MQKNFKILIVYPNIPMMLVTPLSVAVFTWVLRGKGFEVDLFDTTQYGDGDLSSPQNRVKYLQARNLFAKENMELLKWTDMESDFREKLEVFRPDLLLYSFTEDALDRALQLLRVSNTYGIPTVLGGVLATAAPEWLMSFPEVTMLGVGEGEEVVREAAERLSEGKDISTVQNLWIKKQDGSVIRNPIRPYVDLDAYSTDFSLFEESRFVRPMGGKIHRALPIETYRGCPNGCTFCNSPMHKRIAKSLNRVYLRRRSMENVRKEIEHLINTYAINLLYIIDDDFLARPGKEINAFIDIYKDLRIPFWFNTRPEHCSEDVLAKLRDVGLFRVSFGIESGNEDLRMNVLNRHVTNEQLIRYFEIVAKSGIQYSVNCIIGFPFETREMVFDTIRLLKQIRSYDAITVSVFTPYRGTILRDVAIENGFLDPNALTVHTTSRSMLTMPGYSADHIEGLMRAFPLYVEFDESEWQGIALTEQKNQEGNEMFSYYSGIYRKRRWGG